MLCAPVRSGLARYPDASPAATGDHRTVDLVSSQGAAVAASGGSRLGWHEVVPDLRATLESEFGARVVASEGRTGGFSPGLASVLTFDDGRRVFAKAISAARNTFSVDMIRTESAVLAALPAHVPAPRLRWTYDDGEWVALVTDAIDGYNPGEPWNASDLARYLEAATALAQSLTPSPIDAPPISDDDEFRSWLRIAATPGSERLAPWIRAHMTRLAGLDAQWPVATRGASLMHGDFRADNLVLTPDGGFVMVDWPSVRVGPAWLDLLLSLPSVAMHGGGDTEELWSGHALVRTADADAVNVALAGFAGLLISRSLEPVPPLLPTIREFQRAQADVTLRWLFGRMR
jgi:aminoglycoside phosphotransferase (APT) family kinase protein